MTFGFRLLRLTLAGPDKLDAAVNFAPGLNVVTGPSDTGKTYIFQAIDFVLGASAPPKAITEAQGYDVARLAIAAYGGETYELERSLRGGDIRLTSGDGTVRNLKAKHSADHPHTVSSFLLDLSGLAGRRVRTNQSGTTRTVSFRDVAKLALVDEVTVMAPRSPALSGQFTTKTAESRIFRLLLTGEDDASVIAAEDPKKASGRKAGRTEVLETLLARARARREQLETAPRSIHAVEHELAEAIAVATASRMALGEQQSAATEIEHRRRSAWSALRAAESRVDVLQELQTRFGLLEQQYMSDLLRLEAIAEASLRLDQMTAERCPVCGALAADQHHDHAAPQPAPADVRASCEAEAAKIVTLLADLGSTVESNQAELNALSQTRNRHQAELLEIDQVLTDALRPRVAAAAERLQETETSRRTLEHERQLLVQERELEQLLEDGAKTRSVPRADHSPAAAGAGEAEAFTRAAEQLLHAWHFPDVERVMFSETDQDLVISGRPRSSHGKGVRAITDAAFVLALLRHTTDAGTPSAGLAVIDSPLVVYREPDADEAGFSSAVKEYFYKSLASSFRDVQVIILENDPPPLDIASEANLITFTKTGKGRYGFFPVR